MPQRAGLAHVATASFLASRITPSGGYAVALAGGVAVARASQRFGARSGWAASTAAMLQTVAYMGPLRFSIPLTQALSAPVLGRMEARGLGTVPQVLVTAAIRAAHQITMAALIITVILGLEAYTRTYERLVGWLLPLPEGTAGAVVATGIALSIWTTAASIIQVLVYRRGLARWPADAPDTVAPVPEPDLPAPRASAPTSRFDPRAVALAGVVATALLLASTAWLLLAAIAAWLAAAWVTGGGDTSVVRAGLVLAALLAFSTLTVGLLGGIGIDEMLRRFLRAALLVLVATWVRYAAGEEGLREVFRRMLRRLRRVPGARETSALLERLGSTDALVVSGRTLVDRLRDVPKEVMPLADAVLAWVAHEAGRFPGAAAMAELPPPTALRARVRDAVLVVLAVATVVALPLTN